MSEQLQKKKRNYWIWGILVGWLVIVSFNLYFVFRAIETPRDLVYEDYYEKGLAYDEKIQGQALLDSLGIKVYVKHFKEYWEVALHTYKRGVPQDTVAGSLIFYRPADQELDQKYPLQFQSKSRTWLAKTPVLEKGAWKVKVHFPFSKYTLEHTQDYFQE